jgi:hypothetical protein
MSLQFLSKRRGIAESPLRREEVKNIQIQTNISKMRDCTLIRASMKSAKSVSDTKLACFLRMK